MADVGTEQTPSGMSLGKLDTAAQLMKKFQWVKTQRELHERQWKLNLAFYKGRQYTFYNRMTRRIEQLPTEDAAKPRHTVRIVSNQITPGVMAHTSMLLKTKPQMMATPGSGSMQDLQAAEMSERLLEYTWDAQYVDDSLDEAVVWADVTGSGWLKVDWDANAGTQMTFTLGPDGNPIIDDSMKDAFEAQLKQQGIEPQQTVVYMGDVRIQTISPFNFYPDPSVNKFDEAKFAFEIAYLDKDTVKAEYGKDVAPNAISRPADAGLPLGAEDQMPNDVVQVITAYMLPQPTLPRGRVVTFTKDEILKDDPWQLPFRELPFVKLPGIRIPGELYDTSVVEQAIPLQKELNRTISQIVEFKNMNVAPQWKAPYGSMRQVRTREPGAVFEYNPIGPQGLGPEEMPVQSLPAYVFTHLENIQARLSDIFGLTEVTQGNVPPNVEAGVAIDLLQEMAIDRFAPTIRLIELALERMGRFVLQLAQKFYIEPRIMKIRGSGGSYQVYQFTKADLAGAVDVQVETGSGLPRTRAGRQSRILEFVQQGIIPPDQAYKYLDMADLKGLQAQFALDEDQAYREHEKLNTGQPISQVPVFEAQQEIQQLEGMLAQIYGPPEQAAYAQQSGQMAQPWNSPQAPPNPDTQQPFQSWQDFMGWAQQKMQDAALQPKFTDNHAVHMDVHSRFIKSSEFDALPVQIQENYIKHVGNHLTILSSLPANTAGEAPKINLQLKSTVGPSTQMKILEKAGVPITQQDASEPPLETWVSDNIDNPDVDSGAPGEDGGVMLAKVYDLKAQAASAAVTASQQNTHASVQAQADVVDASQEHRHREEKHQADMAIKAQQLANLRKPKPPSKGKE